MELACQKCKQKKNGMELTVLRTLVDCGQQNKIQTFKWTKSLFHIYSEKTAFLLDEACIVEDRHASWMETRIYRIISKIIQGEPLWVLLKASLSFSKLHTFFSFQTCIICKPWSGCSKHCSHAKFSAHWFAGWNLWRWFNFA